jgi:hypothetical protein
LELEVRTRLKLRLARVFGRRRFQIAQRLDRLAEDPHGFAACVLLGARGRLGVFARATFGFELLTELKYRSVGFGQSGLSGPELRPDGRGSWFGVRARLQRPVGSTHAFRNQVVDLAKMLPRFTGALCRSFARRLSVKNYTIMIDRLVLHVSSSG